MLSNFHDFVLVVFLFEQLVLRVAVLLISLIHHVLLLQSLILIPVPWLALFALLVHVLVPQSLVLFKLVGFCFLLLFIEILALEFGIDIAIFLPEWITQALLLQVLLANRFVVLVLVHLFYLLAHLGHVLVLEIIVFILIELNCFRFLLVDVLLLQAIVVGVIQLIFCHIILENFVINWCRRRCLRERAPLTFFDLFTSNLFLFGFNEVWLRSASMRDFALETVNVDLFLLHDDDLRVSFFELDSANTY